MILTPELLIQLAKIGANLEVHADGSFTMISNQNSKMSRSERNQRYYQKKKLSEASENVLNSSELTELTELTEHPSPSSSPFPPSFSLPSTPPLPLTPSNPPSSPPPHAEEPPRRKRKNESIENPEFDESDSEDFRVIMTDWFNYKTQRKERYVETGWKRILAEQRQYPLAKVAASVDKSIRQMWKGLFTDKITEEESVRFLKVENKPSSEEPDIDLFATMLAKRAELQAKEDAENQPPESMEDVEWS
jgi:hypothetical protein